MEKKKIFRSLSNQKKKLSGLEGHLIKGCRLSTMFPAEILSGLSKDYPRTRRSAAHASVLATLRLSVSFHFGEKTCDF